MEVQRTEEAQEGKRRPKGEKGHTFRIVTAAVSGIAGGLTRAIVGKILGVDD